MVFYTAPPDPRERHTWVYRLRGNRLVSNAALRLRVLKGAVCAGSTAITPATHEHQPAGTSTSNARARRHRAMVQPSGLKSVSLRESFFDNPPNGPADPHATTRDRRTPTVSEGAHSSLSLRRGSGQFSGLVRGVRATAHTAKSQFCT